MLRRSLTTERQPTGTLNTYQVYLSAFHATSRMRGIQQQLWIEEYERRRSLQKQTSTLPTETAKWYTETRFWETAINFLFYRPRITPDVMGYAFRPFLEYKEAAEKLADAKDANDVAILLDKYDIRKVESLLWTILTAWSLNLKIGRFLDGYVSLIKDVIRTAEHLAEKNICPKNKIIKVLWDTGFRSFYIAGMETKHLTLVEIIECLKENTLYNFAQLRNVLEEVTRHCEAWRNEAKKKRNLVTIPYAELAPLFGPAIDMLVEKLQNVELEAISGTIPRGIVEIFVHYRKALPLLR